MAEQFPPKITKVADWSVYLHWQRRNKFSYSVLFVTFFIIFAMHWFAPFFQRGQLKGNQVQVLNSPAAVSSIYPYKGIGLLIHSRHCLYI